MYIKVESIGLGCESTRESTPMYWCKTSVSHFTAGRQSESTGNSSPPKADVQGRRPVCVLCNTQSRPAPRGTVNAVVYQPTKSQPTELCIQVKITFPNGPNPNRSKNEPVTTDRISRCVNGPKILSTSTNRPNPIRPKSQSK